MSWSILTGYLGNDAKITEKGCHFSLSSKSGTETVWTTCFVNYQSNVVDYLKKGTLVSVVGRLYLKPVNGENGTFSISRTLSVLDIELLPGKNKEN